MAPTRDYSGRPLHRLHGFSLVELMVAMGIALFLIAGIVSAYTFLGRNLIRYANQQQLEAQSRRTLQTLAQDVHAATDVTSYSANQLVLSLPYVHADGSVTSYTVTYVYDSTARTLTRTISGTAPPNLPTAALTLLTGAWFPAAAFSNTSTGSMWRWPPTHSASRKSRSAAHAHQRYGQCGHPSTYTGASARLILRGKHVVTY